MTFHKSKVHDYLGMVLDYTEKENANLSMIKYVEIFLTGFPEEIGIPAESLEADWMFQVREEEGAKPLPEEQKSRLTSCSCPTTVIVKKGSKGYSDSRLLFDH